MKNIYKILSEFISSFAKRELMLIVVTALFILSFIGNVFFSITLINIIKQNSYKFPRDLKLVGDNFYDIPIDSNLELNNEIILHFQPLKEQILKDLSVSQDPEKFSLYL